MINSGSHHERATLSVNGLLIVISQHEEALATLGVSRISDGNGETLGWFAVGPETSYKTSGQAARAQAQYLRGNT